MNIYNKVPKTHLLRRHPKILLGLFVIAVSIFFFSLILLIPALIKEPYESKNYEEIEKKGIIIQATIVNIKENLNIAIDNKHPTVISYRFTLGGKDYFSKYRTLENDKLSTLQINNTVNIKYLKGESKIDGIEPFSFSIVSFLFVPLPFFIIGMLVIIFSLKPYLAEKRVIKFGISKEATVISFFSFSGLPIINLGKHILVSYIYYSKDGKRIHGTSKIFNLSILDGKKIGDAIEILVSKKDEEESTILDL
jgi:hypothetical protein